MLCINKIVGFYLSILVLIRLFDAQGRPPRWSFPVCPLEGKWLLKLVAGAAHAVHRQPIGLRLGPLCPTVETLGSCRPVNGIETIYIASSQGMIILILLPEIWVQS